MHCSLPQSPASSSHICWVAPLPVCSLACLLFLSFSLVTWFLVTACQFCLCFGFLLPHHCIIVNVHCFSLVDSPSPKMLLLFTLFLAASCDQENRPLCFLLRLVFLSSCSVSDCFLLPCLLSPCPQETSFSLSCFTRNFSSLCSGSSFCVICSLLNAKDVV